MVEPLEGSCQTAMQVKVLSPEKHICEEADGVGIPEGSMTRVENGKKRVVLPGSKSVVWQRKEELCLFE